MKNAQNFQESMSSLLTKECRQFLTFLHQEFESERRKILIRRKNRARAIILGERLDFLRDTRHIRESDWQVAATPLDLQDRRVEITGPAEAKMIINALNSGARVFMADLEDSLSPTWENIILGHQALCEAVRNTLTFESEAGKKYSLNEKTATLLVRPRGLHLSEENFYVHGEAMSGSLFDFGVYFFHNAHELIRTGRTPAFYLPKLEGHLEARWWNQVFVRAQEHLQIEQGTIRATVLIETIPAAFEMHEILFELCDHAAGLNAGRWDYIFSLIKKHNTRADFILPDRSQVTMATGFMSAYAELLVQTCHIRGAHAIGGMAAFIPNRKEPLVTENALKKVTEDKAREAAMGFDGSWVAHPDLVPVAQAEFDRVLGERPHQKEKIPARKIYAAELLDLTIPGAQVTEAGVRMNINVCLQYIERWLAGSGAVAIHNLMEDAATAEISRTQLWQWLHHRAQLADGRTFSRDFYLMWRAEEMKKIREQAATPRLERAMTILDDLVLQYEFSEFLTLEAYPRLLEPEKLFLNWSLPNTRGGNYERTTAGI
jgi:malate synthase